MGDTARDIMATAGPSLLERDTQRPSTGGGSPSKYLADEERKENAARNPLSGIQISSSGRIHGALASPVKVNPPQEDWPQSQRATIIEGSEYSPRLSAVNHSSEQCEPSESPLPLPENIPHRPRNPADYSGNQQAQIPSPHPNTGIVSNGTGRGQGASVDIEDNIDESEDSFANEPVPQLQYHHNAQMVDEAAEAGPSIDRYLTPNSATRKTPLPRPNSTYSDLGARGHSPGYHTHVARSPSWGGRTASAASGRSNERPLSYVDLLNVPYPQAPPAPISFDNSQLRMAVGTNASLLSTQKTLDMYRQNVKKTSDSETQYAFAIFLIQAAQEAGLNQGEMVSSRRSPKPSGPYIESGPTSPQELLREARNILQKLSDRGYPFAQYYLADGYASGLFSKGKEDYGTAFPLFVSASKHGHAESGYRAALCYEFGWGCRKDPAKAIQFYRQSASKNHPGAMTRLGRACLSGDLGPRQYREGLKWLRRASESADQQYNAAPYHLGVLYETGYGDDIFQDETYSAQLFTQAADLGHAEASYRLGDAYEHGKLSCPRDPALSVHFYTGAAQKGHPAAMMALCAWYMVGAEPVLEKDENEAYEWARQAAQLGLTKAQYAVGYFTEMGIGCRRDILEANVWYVKAAEAGDERAKQRLSAIRAAASGGTPMDMAPANGSKIKKGAQGTTAGKEENDKDCRIM